MQRGATYQALFSPNVRCQIMLPSLQDTRDVLEHLVRLSVAIYLGQDTCMSIMLAYGLSVDAILSKTCSCYLRSVAGTSDQRLSRDIVFHSFLWRVEYIVVRPARRQMYQAPRNAGFRHSVVDV